MFQGVWVWYLGRFPNLFIPSEVKYINLIGGLLSKLIFTSAPTINIESEFSRVIFIEKEYSLFSEFISRYSSG